MTDTSNMIIHNGLVAPGVLAVAPAALNYAREVIEAVTAAHGDGNMVMFAWIDLQTSKTDPDGPLELVKDFLDVGAISRSQIPADAVQTVDGLDMAIQIPLAILQKSVQRLIDIDDNAFARLVLK
jgi:hypothetical protein